MEIMIVIAIMGIILAMGIPSFVHFSRKEGMRKASSDMMDACRNARAISILSGQPMDLVLHPKDGTFEVSAPVTPGPGADAAPANFGTPQMNQARTDLPAAFRATLPQNVGIELLAVNFIFLEDAKEARVRFYPNGMSDEFTIMLRSDQGEMRKITLEPVTALADLVLIR
jgi:Tfp pilus assembly protein FimT